MCVVSMVSDHYIEKWEPQVQPQWKYYPLTITQPQISQAEVDEFKRLLQRAREYDKRMNEPNCELEEKKTTLKQLAKQLGVDISFIDDTA